MKPKLIDVKEMKIIQSILEKWSGKLTWDSFTISVAQALNKSSISKFTLMSYEPVKQAFNLKKQALRKAKSAAITSMEDVTVEMLIQENEGLRDQIIYLKMELQEKELLWADQFRRWQYNISQMAKVDLATLDQPLPKK